jgi:hypothetical protein
MGLVFFIFLSHIFLSGAQNDDTSLKIDHVPFQAVRGLFDGLAQCWM